ncbi:DUF1828 domain-containing protein [Rhizobium sp. SSA_523]|uniref:DUF1828 domain-containing protein n=1 Tax=Rhizobium sp. SSA_523 TaxID=2952477 RepID=UPI0020900487|nr:DUF1828 domain-containing protein [Rhizobium sp. SSA_523]MCO5730917.1 DUF1828 domain-containing protein [Rhizobium sp. SSA_523]WKC24271.1 DUF1828 domain-containing protein [Rhizobium sp. SSA_523]
MKADLCHAFCNNIIVTPVPAGVAVSTVFRRDDGDRIAFYVIEEENGLIRLEDDGGTVQMLEGAGVDFETDTRCRAFETLLCSAHATFDGADATIRTAPFPREELAAQALDFVAVLLRMNDFLLLTQEKIASTFRDDAANAIRAGIGGRANIREGEAVNSRLSEVMPDLVVETIGRPPVAIFFGNTESRVHDAIFLHQTAAYEVKEDLSVIALLEQDNSISTSLRRRATNRLTTVPVFRQDEEAAVSRIVREAIGNL